MGAYVSEVAVYCNWQVKDETMHSGYRTCYERLDVRCHRISDARSEAKKAGWAVNVRYSKHDPRNTGRDYCPKHTPKSED